MAYRAKINILLITAALLLRILSTPTSAGLIWQEKLTASDGQEYHSFGYSVSISGDVCVIGARGSPHAYIFRFDGSNWLEEQKFSSSDWEAGDFFGWSVSISGDLCVVGAENDDNKGSAYVFRFVEGIWIVEAKLTASDGEYGDNFGFSVSISGRTCIVGMWRDDDYGNDSGAAYIFRFDGTDWIQEVKLQPQDLKSEDHFGYDVSVCGDICLVGAEGKNYYGAGAGVVYVFRFNGSNWIKEAKLGASDPAPVDSFGFSVSISSNVCVMGSPFDNDRGWQAGSAYIFRFDGSNWLEEAKLTAFDGAADDNFGRSVSISGDVCVIGARYDDDIGVSSGSAYVFRFKDNAWIKEAKLVPFDGAASDYFGGSVASGSDSIVVGAYRKDNYTGAVYTLSICSVADLSGDCSVGVNDLAIIARQWLSGARVD